MNHTKAPWALTDNGTAGVYTFVTSGDITVARVHTVAEWQKANARLIAAAPEMYKAAYNLVNRLDAVQEICKKSYFEQEIQALADALIKARGDA